VSAKPEGIIRDDIRAMSAYAVTSASGLVKLDAMENPYRLPEALRREIGEAVANSEINRYPDPTAPALMKRLRSVMGIGVEYDVLLGNGSDEIIHIIIQTVARSRVCATSESLSRPTSRSIPGRCCARWKNTGPR
jgi:histidinol-phosphate aminotransferase